MKILNCCLDCKIWFVFSVASILAQEGNPDLLIEYIYIYIYIYIYKRSAFFARDKQTNSKLQNWLQRTKRDRHHLHQSKNPYVQGVLISPQPDQEGNKLQRQKILMFIYPIYNHNWRNISTIYIYTGCNRRNGPNFGRVFLMLNYTEKTQNTYVQS